MWQFEWLFFGCYGLFYMFTVESSKKIWFQPYLHQKIKSILTYYRKRGTLRTRKNRTQLFLSCLPVSVPDLRFRGISTSGEKKNFYRSDDPNSFFFISFTFWSLIIILASIAVYHNKYVRITLFLFFPSLLLSVLCLFLRFSSVYNKPIRKYKLTWHVHTMIVK